MNRDVKQTANGTNTLNQQRIQSQNSGFLQNQTAQEKRIEAEALEFISKNQSPLLLQQLCKKLYLDKAFKHRQLEKLTIAYADLYISHQKLQKKCKSTDAIVKEYEQLAADRLSKKQESGDSGHNHNEMQVEHLKKEASFWKGQYEETIKELTQRNSDNSQLKKDLNKIKGLLSLIQGDLGKQKSTLGLELIKNVELDNELQKREDELQQQRKEKKEVQTAKDKQIAKLKKHEEYLMKDIAEINQYFKKLITDFMASISKQINQSCQDGNGSGNKVSQQSPNPLQRAYIRDHSDNKINKNEKNIYQIQIQLKIEQTKKIVKLHMDNKLMFLEKMKSKVGEIRNVSEQAKKGQATRGCSAMNIFSEETSQQEVIQITDLNTSTDLSRISLTETKNLRNFSQEEKTLKEIMEMVQELFHSNYKLKEEKEFLTSAKKKGQDRMSQMQKKHKSQKGEIMQVISDLKKANQEQNGFIHSQFLEYKQAVKKKAKQLMSRVQKDRKQFVEQIEEKQGEIALMSKKLDKLDAESKGNLNDFCQANNKLQSAEMKVMGLNEENKKLGIRVQEISYQNTEMIKKLAECKEKEYENANLIFQLKKELTKAPFIAESKILHPKNDKDIDFVKSSIEKFTGMDVCGSRTVYRLDNRSNISFHDYIDDVPNLLLLIKLENGRVFGGFTVEPFNKEGDVRSVGEGFMFVVNTQKCYFQKEEDPKKGKEKGKAITYDDYYIIWGNSEIRVKSKEDFVFSNFGIVNSYYDSKEDKVDDFLAEGKDRQAVFQEYEFLEVMF